MLIDNALHNQSNLTNSTKDVGNDKLLNHILPVEPLWSAFRPALQTLTDYAVDFRYPGHNASKSHARRALADCKSIRREVRTNLGLPV
jgi:DNA-binding PucR family transcriptional regulator